jgi:mannose-1-phosphate guanylyltransferase
MSICAVIMAGGSGSRLWPLSRASYPKQFLSINSDQAMLQETFDRLEGLDVDSSITICNEEHRFFVADQLQEIEWLNKIILEPVGRNTAPAIALAANSVEDDPLLLVLAADHVIQDQKAFLSAVNDAIPLAESGKLVTFGISPAEANTGYGYIKKGKKKGAGFVVDKFVEKPSSKVAQDYVDSGCYFWNSGMFLFKKSKYLEELKKHRADIYKICNAAVANAVADFDFLRISAPDFLECPSESIDYAVMENTSDAIVVPMEAGWSDIGSWLTVWDLSSKDDAGNSIHGDVMLHNVRNSYLRSDDKLVVGIGIEDIMLVSTKDALMVVHKDSVQDVKIIAEELKAQARPEWESNREVFRPWGKYDSIDSGERYQVKRITVKPGAKLSVQMHHHRAEHWIVVSGTAKVTKGDETFLLAENESVYLPLGIVHALENPGKLPLELIEVQSGQYLGEDDIVRFADKYGRAE